MVRSTNLRLEWTGPNHEMRKRERRRGHNPPDAFAEVNKPARADHELAESRIGLALPPFFEVFPSAELEDLTARAWVGIPALQALIQSRCLPEIFCRRFRDSLANHFHNVSLTIERRPVNATLAKHRNPSQRCTAQVLMAIAPRPSATSMSRCERC
jgi:hypothetical protein